MSSRLILERLLTLVPVLLGATLIAFLLGVLAPGDPAAAALDQGGDFEPDPAAVAALRAEWGLDQSLPMQYANWLGRVLQGDLGVSYFSRRPVLDELFQRLGPTLLLAFSAAGLSALVGIGAGVACALWAGSWLDSLLRNASVMFASLPGFLTSIVLIALFAEWLRLTPTSGYGTLSHLLLPALALSVGESARLLRLTRTQLVETLRQDYVRTARAKGLRERVVALRHALPNGLVNVVTSLGLYLGAILGGAAIIETIFAWPGIGQLAIESIRRQDYPVAQGFVLFSAAIYVAINLLVDLLYGVIDPRTRSQAI
jgi:peptide/nickel transport system permease protein